MINSLFRSAAGMVIAASATLLVIAGSAAPVSAGEAPGITAPGTIAVNTQGIDLASPTGVATVRAQIRSAARRLCDDRNDRSVAAHQRRQQCIAAALHTAMPRLEVLAAAARDAQPDLAQAQTPTTNVRR